MINDQYLLNKRLDCFAFETPAARENALNLMIQTVAAPIIRHPAPLFVLEGPPACGKTIFMQRMLGAKYVLAAPRTPAGWRSAVMSAPERVLTIDGASACLPDYADTQGPAVIVIAGNNVAAPPEVKARSIRIGMTNRDDCRDLPDDTTDPFRIKSALYAVVALWIDDGAFVRAGTLSGFEAWHGAIRGIRRSNGWSD